MSAIPESTWLKGLLPDTLPASVVRLRQAVNEPGYLTHEDKVAICEVITRLSRLLPACKLSGPRERSRLPIVTAYERQGRYQMIVAADCPGCNVLMRCLETRKSDSGPTRRRWRCPKCSKRFTSLA